MAWPPVSRGAVFPEGSREVALMREFLLFYSKLQAKRLLYRVRFRSAPEFTYRVRRGSAGRYRIHVAARDSAFRAILSLRRHTSDLGSFLQVFGNNDYNLRRLERWDDIFLLYRILCNVGSPLILDLGANVGLASLYFAKNWPNANIIAVEPEERNYRLMCENLAGIDNVRPLHAAVAGEDAAVKIVDPNAQAWMMRTEVVGSDTNGAIAALSVQSLLRLAPQGSLPFIVKIDIEGFESNLFSKNTDWVELFPVIIIELHDWLLPGQGSASNFLRVIAQHDRDFICVSENVVSIANTARFKAHPSREH
jgi:FkbM family methyltransferase